MLGSAPLSREEGIGNYVFVRTLGSGASAVVKLARHRRTGLEVAIKIIDKTEMNNTQLVRLHREVRIMKKLQHPHIIQLYEVFETDVTLYLVLEYASGGELYDYLIVHDKMKEKDARAKFLQILSALQYCHNKRIIHRDIKPENILLDENANIKIADFGFSNSFVPGQMLETSCGSPAYAAPELFLGEAYTGPEVDIWSAGIVLYTMTTSCVPFGGRDLPEIKAAVTRCHLIIPDHCSESLQKLLRRMICVDRNNRKSLNNLLDDEWLNADGDVRQALKNIFNLPPALVEDDTPHSLALITPDETVIASMIQKYQFTREEILASLRADRFDFVTSVYRVLWQEKLMKPANEPAAAAGASSPSPKVSSLRMRRKSAVNVNIPEEIIMNNVPYSPAAYSSPIEPVIVSHVVTAVSSPTPQRADLLTDALDLWQSPKTVRASPAKHVDVPAALLSFNANDDKTPPADPTSPKANKRRMGRERSHTVSARPTSSPPSKIALFLGIRPNPATSSIISPPGSPRLGANPASPRPASFAAAAPVPVPSSPTAASAFRPRKISNNSATSTANSSFSKDSATESVDVSVSPVVAALKSPRRMSIAGTTAVNFKPTAATKTPDEPNKPRTLRLFFSSITTSSKSPQEIVEQIMTAAKLIDAKFEIVSSFNFSLVTASCSAEVEICRLPRLTELHGLRFKRRSGSSIEYKILCDKLLANLNL